MYVGKGQNTAPWHIFRAILWALKIKPSFVSLLSPLPATQRGSLHLHFQGLQSWEDREPFTHFASATNPLHDWHTFCYSFLSSEPSFLLCPCRTSPNHFTLNTWVAADCWISSQGTLDIFSYQLSDPGMGTLRVFVRQYQWLQVKSTLSTVSSFFNMCCYSYSHFQPCHHLCYR